MNYGIKPGSLEDRAVGALVGLAVRDALGTAVEFMPRGSFTPVTGIRGGGVLHLRPGEWTDDTSMALALDRKFCGRGICLGRSVTKA